MPDESQTDYLITGSVQSVFTQCLCSEAIPDKSRPYKKAKANQFV